MGLVDRTEVLARTDLAQLATEICGQPLGHGRGAKWHCPNPDHPDEHPSMSIYPGKQGHPRWKCHACGEGGTAVDLLMISNRVDAGAALRELATRAGLNPGDDVTPPAIRTPAASASPAEPPPTQSSPVVDQFVSRTATLLWQPGGDSARQFLYARGLTEPILRANRVGYDPGPRHLRRPKGLPYRGPGIVYPVLDPAGTAIYYQLRYLDPDTAGVRKYDQPIAKLAPNPKLARIRTPEPTESAALVICEGIPDALAAAHTGLSAIAVLGTGHANTDAAPTLAARITTEHPAALYFIAFDNDPPGAAAAHRLAAHLARHAAVAHISPPADLGDLNAWWQGDPQDLLRVLRVEPAGATTMESV